MKVIDGKKIAALLRAELQKNIDAEEVKPGLAVVIVGNDPASQIYVRNKIKACAEMGVISYSYALPEETTQEELEKLLDRLAQEEKVHGILLQLPLPKHLDAESASLHIPFEKDVDGFSTRNLGLLLQGKQEIAPCTPSGIMKLLEWEGIALAGKHAVVLGRSETVGKPMAMLLLSANATVTICHSKTENLKEICQQADILVSAVGKAGFVTADMVKPGAVVIDVGMNRNEEGKLCGDVDFDGVKEKTSYITPVPGGVGPMTITMLLYNTYTRFKR
ncbi:MAG: bifunctional methylenetetrahydrofolate dehydrogenase/methenyltetrahydrofolate cyclohydrolase FolD, partial [Clostridia bacterium]|nr:bifunctional methylenetetrahydrofolate dehydrogenase/methenyltetrahydrofolate cyclohydrolase FolD [Clostridia bacterium]